MINSAIYGGLAGLSLLVNINEIRKNLKSFVSKKFIFEKFKSEIALELKKISSTFFK